MIPKSLSASALDVFVNCPARYKAENVDRAPRTGDTSAADLGTAFHNTAELFVKTYFLGPDRQPLPPDPVEVLVTIYRIQWEILFGSDREDHELFQDGIAMLKRWWERQDLTDPNVEVISAEVKSNFPVSATLPDGNKITLPFNYIWDRCDRVQRGEKKTIRVVDYKTWRMMVQPDGMLKKLQMRVYALAAAIQFKDEEYEEIWVVLDQVRHNDGFVGVVFRREELESTWKAIRKRFQQIVDTPDDGAEERINVDCRYCIRKVACDTVKQNALAGGIHGFTIEELIRAKADLEDQMKAMKSAVEEADNHILRHMEENDIVGDWVLDSGETVSIGGKWMRSIDSVLAAEVVGPDVMTRYGNLTITNVDRLLKSGELTDTQVAELKRLIVKKPPKEFKPKVTRGANL